MTNESYGCFCAMPGKDARTDIQDNLPGQQHCWRPQCGVYTNYLLSATSRIAGNNMKSITSAILMVMAESNPMSALIL